MQTNEIEAKTILTKSGLPHAEWAINPYVGCGFGCKYCYAAFIGRWTHPDEDWGSFVDVKINAAQILALELEKMSRKFKSKDFGTIFFSSVTDPYQGAEASHEITRKCLEVLVNFGYQGEISILTKSPLVIRDRDIFKRLNVKVGMTVTTINDDVVRFLEGAAPAATLRIKTLRDLNKMGIATYAFVGPLLPYFSARADKLDEIFAVLTEVGVTQVFVEHLNLSSKIRERLFEHISKYHDLIPYFQKAQTYEYQRGLEEIIHLLAKKYGIQIIGGKVINHGR